MNKHSILVSILLCSVVSQSALAFDFLKKIQKQLDAGAMGASNNATMPSMSGKIGGSNTGGEEDWFSKVCAGSIGAVFKPKALSANAETLVAKYFHTPADLEKKLLDGITRFHQGTLVSLGEHRGDLRDKAIEKLADAFIANPSVEMLAQIIEHAEHSDAYQPEDEPSELAEAQVLLAMVMMQYPQLTKNKSQVLTMLKRSDNGGSSLGTIMRARAHLFGDYAEKDIPTFTNLIGGRGYHVKLKEQSVFYALEKVPNWSGAKQWRQLIQQSEQMRSSLEKQQGANARPDLERRILALMKKGEEINALTLEALGAGPKVAELRAMGEQLRKQGSGEGSLIEIEATQSDSYRAEFEKLLAAKPSLNASAKAQFEKAIQLRADNLTEYKSLRNEAAVRFLSGAIGETATKTGPAINKYFRNACNVTLSQIKYGQEVGVARPMVSKDKLAEAL